MTDDVVARGKVVRERECVGSVICDVVLGERGVSKSEDVVVR